MIRRRLLEATAALPELLKSFGNVSLIAAGCEAGPYPNSSLITRAFASRSGAPTQPNEAASKKSTLTARSGSLVWPPPDSALEHNTLLASLLKQAEESRPAPTEDSDPSPSGRDLHHRAALQALEASRGRLQALLKEADPARPHVLLKTSLRKLPVKALRGELKALGLRSVHSKDQAVERLLRLLRPVMGPEEAKAYERGQQRSNPEDRASKSEKETTSAPSNSARGTREYVPWPSDTQQVALDVASALVDMRCRDVLVIRVAPSRNLSGHPFWGLVLATGTSDRHCRASAEGLIFQLAQKFPGCDLSTTRPGKYSGRVESGLRREELSGWEVVDLTDPGPGLMVSVMVEDVRAAYDLEGKWSLPDVSNVIRVEPAIEAERTASSTSGQPAGESERRRVLTLEDLSREAEQELAKARRPTT